VVITRTFSQSNPEESLSIVMGAAPTPLLINIRRVGGQMHLLTWRLRCCCGCHSCGRCGCRLRDADAVHKLDIN